MQLIIFWYFEVMHSKEVLASQTQFGIIDVFRLSALLKLVAVSLASLSVHSGSLKIMHNLKLYSLNYPISVECFTALKGTDFSNFIC